MPKLRMSCAGEGPRARHRRRAQPALRIVSVTASLLIVGQTGFAAPIFEVLKHFPTRPAGQPSAAVVADGALYGTTQEGPEGTAGTIFRINETGAPVTLHTFSGSDGRTPQPSLVPGPDGALYGATQFGGAHGAGTIFRLDRAGVFRTLISFTGSFNLVGSYEGWSPPGDFLFGSDGSLYGTTRGGADVREPSGTVFRLDRAENFSPVRTYRVYERGPVGAGLAFGSDGAVYGVTSGTPVTLFGRPPHRGSIFRIGLDGRFRVLHEFSGPDGQYPNAPLVLGGDGALYGSAASDERTHLGTLFRVEPDGSFRLLHALQGPDGAHPKTLRAGADGRIYGFTARGGATHRPMGWVGNGTVFRIEPSGDLTQLHSFTDAEGVPYPQGIAPLPLVLASDGTLHGVTSRTVFQIDSTGSFRSSHAFDRDTWAVTMAPGEGGEVFGATQRGGKFGNGSIFRVDAAGSFSLLHSFGASDGYFPLKLVRLPGGALIGVTTAGGEQGLGTVFQIDRRGGVETVSSLGPWSNEPWFQNPLRGPGGAHYYTTPGGAFGLGSVERIDRRGVRTTLHSFDGGADGQRPTGLTSGIDGRLYGSTQQGGSHGAGTVYRIERSGALTTLYSFSALGNDLTAVHGPVYQGADGALYGVDENDDPDGTLFRIDRAGRLTTLQSFDPTHASIDIVGRGSDGALYAIQERGCEDAGDRGDILFRIERGGTLTPVDRYVCGVRYQGPVAGGDGALYGTTGDSLYRVDPSGLTVLHTFSGGDGWEPSPHLVRGIDGALYGTTRLGGIPGGSGKGTIFQIDRAGRFSTLHVFDGVNGTYPAGPIAVGYRAAPLVLGDDGALYGIAQGGANGTGVVFRLAKRKPELSWREPAAITLGTPLSAAQLDATANIPGNFRYTPDLGTVLPVGRGQKLSVDFTPADNVSYNPAKARVRIDVRYPFEGFFPPVLDPPARNRVKAGRVVPISFELGGDQGLRILAKGSPRVERIPCGSGAAESKLDGERAKRAPSNPLRFEAATGRYTFLWKTHAEWAGSCRSFSLELIDGSVHRAEFRFPGPKRD